METDLIGNEDFLLPNIRLGMMPTAKYVKSRRNATVHSAIGTASATGVSTIKYTISSSTEWLDAESVVVCFDVNNLEAGKDLHPACVGAHCLVERVQVRCGGQLLEDIDHFGAVTEAFERCIPAEKRLNFGGLGFGQELAMVGAGTTPNIGVIPQVFQGGTHSAKKIAGGGTKRVYMRLGLLGLTSSKKWIPLWAIAGGIEIFLTLAPVSECMISGAVTSAVAANSLSFNLSNIKLNCDMLTIDPALDEEYAKTLREGAGLKLHFKTWNVGQQFLPASNGGNVDISIQKAYTRLANVFCLFSKEFDAAEKQGGQLQVNTFNMFSEAEESLETFLTLGSQKYPDFPNKGVTEHYWRMLTSLGVALSLPHSVNVDYESFKSNSFIWSAELEKAPMVAASGADTTGGQELAIHVKNFIGASATDIPRRALVVLHHEIIVDIMAGGVLLKT